MINDGIGAGRETSSVDNVGNDVIMKEIVGKRLDAFQILIWLN